MSASESVVDVAVAAFLEQQDLEPGRTPAAFSQRLTSDVRSGFLAACEEIARCDGLLPKPVAPLPEVLGGYRIVRPLGRGGMGTVLEAVDLRHGTRVALKVLHPEMAMDARMVARFRREAEAVAAIQHPGIVKIRGRGADRGYQFLVMELCAGCSLARLLAARKDSAHPDHGRAVAFLGDRPRLLRAFAAVAEALDAAHGQGFVHRDIKPGNLMVSAEGRLTVLDFGLVRSEAHETQALTRTAELFGTPSYIAPEQIEGAGGVDGRADVYGLGAVLYECLTGGPPFSAAGIPALLNAILSRNPTPAFVSCPQVPRVLSDLVARAMSKDPRDRQPSAGALAVDLGRIAHRPSPSRRPVWKDWWSSRWQQIVRWSGLQIRVRVVVLVALVGLGVGFVESSPRDRAQAQPDLQAVADALALDWCVRSGRVIVLSPAQELSPRARLAFERAAAVSDASDTVLAPAAQLVRTEPEPRRP